MAATMAAATSAPGSYIRHRDEKVILYLLGLYSLFIPLFPLSFSAGVRVCLSLIQRVNMDKEEKTNVGIMIKNEEFTFSSLFLFFLCSYRVNIQQ